MTGQHDECPSSEPSRTTGLIKKSGKQGVKFSCFLEEVEEARRSECSCINQMSVLTFTAVFPSLLVSLETILNHFPVSYFGHANLEHLSLR